MVSAIVMTYDTRWKKYGLISNYNLKYIMCVYYLNLCKQNTWMCVISQENDE